MTTMYPEKRFPDGIKRVILEKRLMEKIFLNLSRVFLCALIVFVETNTLSQ